MKTIVFSGPSITEAEVRSLSTATHAPPIKRGDLMVAAEDHDVLVIVDGEFGQSRSISPKEILSALDRGRTVIGAASMGALRASELDRYGMIGIGWVYDRFRRCAVRRDADVALVYSPFDFKAMTVPMVDVEWWFEQAFAARIISSRQRGIALRAARRLFFAERTPDRLMASLAHAIGSNALEALLASVGGTIPSVKSTDAALAIRLSASLAPAAER